MEEIILWKGTIREIEPPEYSKPILWLDCDYDSGHLIYDGKVTNSDHNSHLLVLENGHNFQGKVGQQFIFSIKLYDDYEYRLSEPVFLLATGVIADLCDKFDNDWVNIKVKKSSGLLCPKEDGEIGLMFEKDKAIGRIGQIVQLFLQVI